MLKFMREQAALIMWLVIVIFVGGTLFMSSTGLSSKNRERIVGKIEDKKIKLREFDQKVDRERENMRMQSEKGELTPQQSKMVPQQVWEAEVSRFIHNEIFKDMSLVGTAEEIYDYMKNSPPPGIVQHEAFQTDSAFDTTKYIDFLNRPESFDNRGMQELETYAKNVIVPMQKLRTIVELGVVPARVEIEQEYREENDKAQFEYAKVSSNSFTVDSSEITDELIKTYYTANPDTFVEDAQSELYFIKVLKTATPDDEKSYQEELLEIKKRVAAGEATFEEEAKIESDDEGSAINGGDVGWFGKGQMVPAFEEAAFALEPGEMSGIVKSNFGYHLILVEDKEISKDKKTKTEEVVRVKAKHILCKIGPSAETLDSLEDYLEAIRDSALIIGLKDAVKDDNGLKVDSTGLFVKGAMVKGVGYLFGVSTFAFSRDEELEPISQRLGNEDAIYLFSVKRKTEKGVLPLADVKKRIFKTVMNSKKDSQAKAYIEKIKKYLDKDASIVSLGESDSIVTSGVSDTVSRKQYVADVGYNNAAVATAFILEPGTMSNIVKADKSYFLIKTLYKDLVKEIPWKSEKIATVKDNLVSQNKRNAYMEWYTSYKNTFEIEDNVKEYFE